MAPSKFREGERRTCPYCGQAAAFSLRTRVIGADNQASAPAGAEATSEGKPGWTCENKRCTHRYDFNL